MIATQIPGWLYLFCCIGIVGALWLVVAILETEPDEDRLDELAAQRAIDEREHDTVPLAEFVDGVLYLEGDDE